MAKNVAYLNHCSTDLYIINRLVADLKGGTYIFDDDQRSGPEFIKTFFMRNSIEHEIKAARKIL